LLRGGPLRATPAWGTGPGLARHSAHTVRSTSGHAGLLGVTNAPGRGSSVSTDRRIGIPTDLVDIPVDSCAEYPLWRGTGGSRNAKLADQLGGKGSPSNRNSHKILVRLPTSTTASRDLFSLAPLKWRPPTAVISSRPCIMPGGWLFLRRRHVSAGVALRIKKQQRQEEVPLIRRTRV
jgi:hypothetical protein